MLQLLLHGGVRPDSVPAAFARGEKRLGNQQHSRQVDLIIQTRRPYSWLRSPLTWHRRATRFAVATAMAVAGASLATATIGNASADAVARGATALLPHAASVLKVLTWNTLAPCYFRDGRRVEAEYPDMYLARHSKIAEQIAAAAADVVCLQEHWFENRLMRLYEDVLGSQYNIYTLRRSGNNCDGRSADGVALLLRRGAVAMERRRDVLFHDYGIPQDRVALLAVLRNLRTPGEQRFAVLCTHLTYPHNNYDERSRGNQMAACLDAIQSETQGSDTLGESSMPVLVCGDLNGPVQDNVGTSLHRNGFRPVWDAVYGQECGATHVDHRGGQFASDHVFLLNTADGEDPSSLKPTAAHLLPHNVPDTSPLIRPRMGAFEANDGKRASNSTDGAVPAYSWTWSDLSDHRPLLVELEWPGSVTAASVSESPADAVPRIGSAPEPCTSDVIIDGKL